MVYIMKKRLICIFLSITIVLSLFIIRFCKFYSIGCINFSNVRIKADVTMEINNDLAHIIDNNQSKIKNIINIKYSSKNEITAIEIDSGIINSFSNEISTKINEKIIDCERKYGIPLGNALGSKLFSGLGPRIGIRVLPVGVVNYKMKSELISGGINQTIYRITVDFITEIRCMVPFEETVVSIETSLILAETLIIGKVPDVALSPLG